VPVVGSVRAVLLGLRRVAAVVHVPRNVRVQRRQALRRGDAAAGGTLVSTGVTRSAQRALPPGAHAGDAPGRAGVHQQQQFTRTRTTLHLDC